MRADRSLGNDDDVSLLDGVALVVKSPGVPREHPLVAAARVPVWGEVELAARLLPARLVGVTGTNGKTTTSELLGAMLGAKVAGNVGRALSELDGEVADGELVVVELSSFQLEDVDELRCAAAILLNLEPDHLDRHGSFEAYRDAKLRIFENQGAEDVAVVPRGFPPVPGRGAADRVRRGRSAAGRAAPPWPPQPRERGRRDRRRARARRPRRADRRGAADVRGGRAPARGGRHRRRRALRQRLEGDERRRRAAGARGDRRADRPHRRRARQGGELRAARGGGSGTREGGRARRGDGGRARRGARRASACAHEPAESLEQAVSAAARRADPGDVVLLSPAAASFDQFRDFEHRGQEFKRLVRTRLG